MGPARAFKRSVVLAVGGYSGNTIIEDTDTTVSLLEAGYKTAFEPRAHAFIEAPSTFQALINQRSRWMYGIMQLVWKYRHLFFKCNATGWYGLPVSLNVLSIYSFPAFVALLSKGLKNIWIFFVASAAFQVHIKILLFG